MHFLTSIDAYKQDNFFLIRIAGENRSYQIKNSPLVQENTSDATMNSPSNGIPGTSSAEPSPQKLKDSKR